MAGGDTDEEETKIQLLLAIREIFQTPPPGGDTKSGDAHISVTGSPGETCRREGEPWAAWWEKDIAAGNTRGPGARLAKLLKSFGIVPRTIRQGNDIQKGYPLGVFQESFGRYLPPYLRPNRDMPPLPTQSQKDVTYVTTLYSCGL